MGATETHGQPLRYELWAKLDEDSVPLGHDDPDKPIVGSVTFSVRSNIEPREPSIGLHLEEICTGVDVAAVLASVVNIELTVDAW